MDYRNYYPYSEYYNGRYQPGYRQVLGQTAGQMSGQMPGQVAYYQDNRVPMNMDMDMADEEQLEKDMEYLRSMYPDMAKRIQRYVDEECDKMEYDGSIMFDEYPDRTMLRRIGTDIYNRVNEDGELENEMPVEDEAENMNMPNMSMPNMNMPNMGMPNMSSPDMESIADSFNMSDEEMYALEYRGGRRPNRRDHNNPVRELVDVILFNEIFKRRCRHNRCRRRMYW